ncbi:MAG: transcriptional regulator [Acidimicrobiia bacterium]
MTAESYNVAVGQRLRGIRKQKGLSLQDVEARSEQEFKASVLGAYERGERSLSLPRMQRLASFYGVPVDQLLPPSQEPASAPMAWPSGGITIDLNRVESADEETAALIERFLRSIQVLRQDFNGRILTIRHSDLRLLAGLVGANEETLRDLLVEAE